MKTLAFVLIVLLAIISVQAQNNVDAKTPEDVEAFRVLHADDTYILFFHNSDDSKQTGFFESIFGLFGSKGDLDEEYQRILAEKYPTLEIDAKINALKKVPDDYEVGIMPYIIAYDKGKEIWREMPSKQSSTIIENIIKEKKQGVELKFDNSGRDKPLHVAKPATTVASVTPVVKPTTTTSTQTSYGSYSSDGGMIELVDPFDDSIRYKVNRTDYFDSDYGHLSRGEGYRGGSRVVSTHRGPGTAVISEPMITTAVGPAPTVVPGGFYRGESSRVVERPRQFVQESLAGPGARIVSSGDALLTQGGYARSGGLPFESGARIVTSGDASFAQGSSVRSSGRQIEAGTRVNSTLNGARNTTISTKPRDSRDEWGGSNAYGPAESTGGVVVRKYDADKRP